MEPEEKVLRLSPFIAKAVLIASIGGILFGCKVFNVFFCWSYTTGMVVLGRM
jgi:hypothetical protein